MKKSEWSFWIGSILFFMGLFAGCSRIRIEDFSDRSFTGPIFKKIAVEYSEPDTIHRRKAENALVSALQERIDGLEAIPMYEVIFIDGRMTDQEFSDKLCKLGFEAYLSVRMTRRDPECDAQTMIVDLDEEEQAHVSVGIDLSGQKTWFVCELIEAKELRCVWRANVTTEMGSILNSFRSSIHRIGHRLAERMSSQRCL
jgi:hypothetical protein